MFRTTTQNRIGYGVLALGVIAGLIGAFVNDAAIKSVNKQQTRFIIDQCLRDDKRNDIVVESLKGAKARAIVTYKDNPLLQAIETAKIQDQIDEFNNNPPCKLP